MFSIQHPVQALQRHWRLSLSAFAIVMAVLYDLFFWQKQNGFGTLAYVIIYLSVFVCLAVMTQHLQQKSAMLLIIPIIVLAIDTVLYNNGLTVYFTPKLIVVLLFFFSVLLTLKNPEHNGFWLSRIAIFRRIEKFFVQLGHVFGDIFSWGKNDNSRLYKQIAIGILIAVPLLMIFGSIFMDADPVFAEKVKNLFDFGIDEILVWRIVRTVLMALFLASFLYLLFSSDHVLTGKSWSIKGFDPIVVGIVLGLINLLFLAFVLVQIKYLFGSADFVLTNGLTFAEYARSGFFQLLPALVLAGFVILVAHHSSSQQTKANVLKFLQILFVVLVGVVGASALKRMNLYQAEYGYTVERLLVEWFIYFIFVLLVVTIVHVLSKRAFRQLLYTSLILGLISITFVFSMNVDLIIAKKNISRYISQGKELDVSYLFWLSSDIVPALDLLSGHTVVGDNVKGDYLGFIKSEKEQVQKDDSLLEFNWGRFKAREFFRK